MHSKKLEGLAENAGLFVPEFRRRWFAVGAGLVALQRIAIPVGDLGISAYNVLLAAGLALAVATGRVKMARGRSIFFILCVSAALAICIASNSGAMPLLLVATFWFPAILLMQGAATARRSFLGGIVCVAALSGLWALIQSLASHTLGVFLDPLSRLPDALKLEGFNSTDPVAWGSTWMKANGGIFPEPSLLSLGCGLALVVLASGSATFPDRISPWKPAMLVGLVLGLVTSVAASGMIFVPALVVAVLARGVRPLMVAMGSVAGIAVVLLQTPLWEPLASRVFTTDLQTGSNSARLVRPYSVILANWLDEGPWYGNGPGSARDFSQATFIDWRNEVTTPTAVKLLYEYGLLGALVAGAVVLALLTTGLAVSMRIALLAMVFVPTDGLTTSLIAGVAAVVLMGESGGNGKAGRRQSALDVPLEPGDRVIRTVATEKSLRFD